jgi:hypothetical protein
MLTKHFIIVLLATACIFSQNPPAEVLNLVNEKLKGKDFLESFYWLSKKPSDLKTSTEKSKVNAGTPVQIARMNWTAVDSAKENAPVSSIIDLVDGWDVPILIKGKINIFITVIKQNGKWEVFGMGQPAVACGWQKVLERWPSPKYHGIIIGAGNETYFSILEQGDYNLTELIFLPYPVSSKEDKVLFKKRLATIHYSTLTPSAKVIRMMKSKITASAERAKKIQ